MTLFPILLFALFGQLQPPTAGCRILDASWEAHYVTYERFGDAGTDKKGHTRHLVWLRFHNNTSCDVFLPGGRDSRSVSDGQECTIAYSVFLKDDRGPSCYECSDVREVGDPLPAGHTAVFAVLQRHFLVGERIAVPFGYAWEGFAQVSVVGAPFVQFDGRAIPKADRQQFHK